MDVEDATSLGDRAGAPLRSLSVAKLFYSAIASLDGYVEDSLGRFEWGAPDDEVLGFINDLERPVATYLYGRRMYETMVYWETAPLEPGGSGPERDFTEIWRSAEKIVYSRTVDTVSSARTRVERAFDAAAVRELKEKDGGDLSVGGAELAGQALAADLVDELQLFVVPVVVGGGKSWLPADVWVDLELLETRSFAGGVAFLRYRPTSVRTRTAM
jgi:dihydrofolate reductase